jgi:hypothetical protein
MRKRTKDRTARKETTGMEEREAKKPSTRPCVLLCLSPSAPPSAPLQATTGLADIGDDLHDRNNPLHSVIGNASTATTAFYDISVLPTANCQSVEKHSVAGDMD